MTFISYAQNYEDVMLFRALRGIESGFYIDVGAQDPVADSVTKAFYDRGWRGINIEPAPHWHQKLEENRPRDINLRVAASDRHGTMRFYDVAETGLSTTQPEFASQSSEVGRQVLEYEVECRTLGEICEEHAVGEIHFLKIDVEGAEAAVLRGLPLDRVQPWVIVVEATLPNSQTPAWEEWQPLLDAHGYACVYEDGLNRFYLSPRHPELKQALHFPPNVFDDFILQRTASALDYLQGENERREMALVELRAALNAQTVDLKERDSLLAQQTLELRARESELSVLREEADRLRAEADHLHVEAIAAELALNHQQKEIHARDQTIAEFAEAVRALHESVSWRVTAPLRWMSGGTRRVLRMIRRLVVHVLRPPARLMRPLLRVLARSPWLSALGRKLFGQAVAARASLFLFGSSALRTEESGQARRSRWSRRVSEEIQAIRGKAPRKPR